ncbi:signal peptidase I [Herbaspirillum robiniae]|uniref:Signal peptidase I n=1 Tax=Herbaspirillum robiniae TaxID=2014887 RepID=A0A246WU01_9BURK|nr:signal peptidase I [Herbaspirillum robiniae]OWY30555.1 signal peptidase I [Herbaspirillum robiniae]
MKTLKNLLGEYKGLMVFMALMVVFRSAIADYNVVPSGSMLPTVMIGDRILVNKLAYDLRVPLTHISIARLGEPRRGDIVTVDSKEAGELLLKRVIGLPGDVVELRDNVLYINGQAASYSNAAIRAPEGDATDRAEYRDEHLGDMSHLVRLSQSHPSLRSSYGPVVVPADQYLMLGDNRDNSADSRYYGFFGRSELMGRTRRIAFSLDADHGYRPRLDRFGQLLDEVAASR